MEIWFAIIYICIIVFAVVKLNKNKNTFFCNIYCKCLSHLDQICSINNKARHSWQHLISSCSYFNEVDSKQINGLRESLFNYISEVESLLQQQAQPDYKKSYIYILSSRISKNKVDTAISSSTQMRTKLLENLKNMLEAINDSTKINTLFSITDKKLISYQHEANAVYYGILKEMCVFPKSTLTQYNNIYNNLKFLPVDKLDKAPVDYKHLQEIESTKSAEVLKISLNRSSNDSISLITKKIINVFFAGSTALQSERNIFTNVISQLQTSWKDRNLQLYAYSFQNFKHHIEANGNQSSYEDFIRNDTDLIFFVLDGEIGGITQKEFDIAMSSYKMNHKPLIFVYSQKGHTEECADIKKLRAQISESSNYWQDYENDMQLGLLLKTDLLENIQKIFDNYVIKELNL